MDESKGLEKEERFTRPSRKQRRIEDDDDGEEEEEESSTVPKFPKALKDFTFLPPSVSQRGRVRKPTEIMRQNWLQNRRKPILFHLFLSCTVYLTVCFN